MTVPMNTILQQHTSEHFTSIHGDCVEAIRDLPDNSIGFSVYSPPFADLFIYSDSERDMGNTTVADFKAQYRHLVADLLRVHKPGRLTAVHCSDLPRSKERNGFIGIYDFPSDIREVHEAAGWTYVSRITVWKDPVVEMQRTKTLGLLYKQVQKDSTRSRQGLPDYVLIFRKTPDDEKSPLVEPVGKDSSLFPVDMWQQWASPVWMDIDQTDVLNVRAARAEKDEKHLCPLQLGLIERAIRLWSNPDDVILSPFAGIGSEGYVALRNGRKFIGVELKQSYFNQQVRNLQRAEAEGAFGDLFTKVA